MELLPIDWDHLVRHYGAGYPQVTLALIVNYHSYALLLRRSVGEPLAGCYEPPQGIFDLSQSVVSNVSRILKEECGLSLGKIQQFVHAFTYLSGRGKRAVCIVLAVVPAGIEEIDLFRHDHGLWVQPQEIRHQPVITDFAQALFYFWLGGRQDPLFHELLLQQAQHRGAVRYKVRVVVIHAMEVLLLKRSRRARSMPLLYELPGMELAHAHEIEPLIYATVFQQTGLRLKRVIDFLGSWDYMSLVNHSHVSELVYLAVTQEHQLQLYDHAYATWTGDVLPSLPVVPMVPPVLRAYRRRLFLDIPERVRLPYAIYPKMKPQQAKATEPSSQAREDLAWLGKARIHWQAARRRPIKPPQPDSPSVR